MAVKKSYCGLCLIQAKGICAVIDSYSMEVRFKGPYEECNTFFNNYIEKISEKDN